MAANPTVNDETDSFWDPPPNQPGDDSQQPGYYVQTPQYTEWKKEHPDAGPTDYSGIPSPTAPKPPPTPAPTPPPGGGGGTPAPPQSTAQSSYTPPAFTPSPFINPNGTIPAGMPFSPDPAAVAQQNAALKTAMETPAIQPNLGVDPQLMQMQDDLLKRVLTENPFGQDYLNQLNEQQKELALRRSQGSERTIMQQAANRGTLAGGRVQGALQRNDDLLTQNLLQSNRDVNLQVADLNSKAGQASAQLGESILGGRQDRSTQQQSLNRSALLDALNASENVYGGREDRGLATSKFAEAIREYDQDLLNRQAEYGSGLNFNYDSLDSGNYNSWLNYLANLSQ